MQKSPLFVRSVLSKFLPIVLAAPFLAQAQSVTPVVFPNDPAPGGGTYSGIDFENPTTLPDGSVFFKDSSIPTTVGFPGSLQSLNIQASTIAGLNLAVGESLDLATLTLLSSPSAGSYILRVGLTPSSAGTAIIAGTPGNFTKIIKSGEALPGTNTPWPPMRFSPSFFSPTVGTTRSGQPIIDSLAADDSTGFIGIYRNGAWEITQFLGVDVPGFAVGSRFRPGTTDIIDVKGNANGQFLFTNTIFNGPTNLAAPLGQGTFLGQNGSLQLIAKSSTVLPGDSRMIGTPKASSINDAGTVALSGNYIGSGTGAGWVYRWSAAGGMSKVISEGDPLPSVGPRAVFTGLNGFQFPLINASGALLFFGEVNLYGYRDSSIGRSSTLLYQAAPGAPIEMVARSGETVRGLPTGSVVGLTNSNVFTFNDAGQFSLHARSLLPQSNTFVDTLIGGLAPNASVLARVGTPLNMNGRSGSSLVSSIINVQTPKSGRVTGEMDSTLSTGGDAYFRGVLVGSPGFFGQSGVFRAQLNGTTTGTLASQVITFSPPRDVVVGGPSTTLSATSSSGLPVSFSRVTGPVTVVGNIASFNSGTGDVVVRASQAGNSSFLAAESVDYTFKVVATAADLPLTRTGSIRPIALIGNPAPGGGTYSGVDFEEPRVTASGEVTFKDAVTADVVSGEGVPVRLNLYSSTVAGLTLNAGETLDRVNPTVLSRTAAGSYFLRVPITTGAARQEVLVSGTPGTFTKILRTGDALPGTTSIWTYDDNLFPLPKTTRGGDPIVYAISPNGLNSHIGIYRNSTWEVTQILGTTPPNFAINTKFNNVKFTAANQSGQFLFTSESLRPPPSSSLFNQALFLGSSSSKQLITGTEVGTTIGGDPRQILTAFSYSLNSSGTALVHGDYRPVSGNSNQGGFLYRWSSSGGFAKIATRGDLLPGISATAKFYTITSEPLINDNGAVLFFASVDLLGTGVNYTTALLYQTASNAAIQKVVLAGEFVAGLPPATGIRFNNLDSLHFNNAGQFALFADAVTGSPHSTIYGGTAPAIGVVADSRANYIEGLSGRKSFSPFVSVYLDPNSVGFHGVAGEFGARLSNNGLIPFRSDYGAVGSTRSTGVFVANLNGLPAPAPVAQTITFAAPSDRLINSSFTPSGTATSGLPLTYQIISGPASVSGASILTTGTSGLVTVRASQAGNASFLAATNVDRTFRVVATSSELAMTNYLAAANVPPEDRLASLDLDRDGMSNLLEFALGGAPLLADPQILPTVSTLNGQFRFTYTRAQQGSVNYSVAASLSLMDSWSPSGVDQGTVGQNGQTIATIPIAGSSRFLRLEVTLKP